MEPVVPDGVQVGPYQGHDTIGVVTESLHRWLLDGWTSDEPPPRLEEDLSFVPKDRENVIYTYMYRVTQNTNLKNPKRLQPTPFSKPDLENPEGSTLYYESPPLFVNLFYMIAVHAKFRSDAERLLGWAMMRLHFATHLVYRPRRYVLPDGQVLDSNGNPWAEDNQSDGLHMEKVSLGLVEDMTVGDAVNFFTIHEAPYRPYATYLARACIRGPIVQPSGPTVISSLPLETMDRESGPSRPNGRVSGRMQTRPRRKPPGPQGFGLRPLEDDSENEG